MIFQNPFFTEHNRTQERKKASVKQTVARDSKLVKIKQKSYLLNVITAEDKSDFSKTQSLPNINRPQEREREAISEANSRS